MVRFVNDGATHRVYPAVTPYTIGLLPITLGTHFPVEYVGASGAYVNDTVLFDSDASVTGVPGVDEVSATASGCSWSIILFIAHHIQP